MSHKAPIQNPKKSDKSTEIFDVRITGTQMNQVLSKIWLQRKEMLHVATVNPEFIMEARTNQKFKQVLDKCLTVADGHGVIWAHKILEYRNQNADNSTQNVGNRMQGIQNHKLERISGTQLVETILQHADKLGERVFLLGAADGVAQKAADVMKKKYPNVKLAWFAGARTVKLEKNEEASMTIAKINGFEPDYLLVAYGSPSQDIWIEENRPYLRTRVAMGVGGVLDEWAGLVQLPPDWVDRVGLKWMWRLMVEPKRVSRIMRVLHFGLLVLYKRVTE